MTIDITILGTAGSMPTKERNVAGIYLVYKGEGMLFDCGEGTQRQLKMAGISPAKVKKIFISHWHGDHVIGLLGLIQTLGLGEYQEELHIYGPPGTKKYMQNMANAIIFDQRIDIKVHEIKPGKIVDARDYIIEARPLSHRTTCFGYAFIEKDKRRMNVSVLKKLKIPMGPLVGQLQNGKTVTFKGKKIKPEKVSSLVKGKKIAFVSDTIVCKGAVDLAKNADLVISEAAFHSELEQKAEDYSHLTAQQAGQIASQANAKKLVITHFSARYKDVKELEDDAKAVFPNTTAARDLMKIKV